MAPRSWPAAPPPGLTGSHTSSVAGPWPITGLPRGCVDRFPSGARSIGAYAILAGHFVQRGVIERQLVDPRLPCAIAETLARVRGDLIQPGEPDAALRQHVFDEVRHGIATRGAARDERMPDRDPQRTVPP